MATIPLIIKTIVFGGSFDPIHQGHLDCMISALNELPTARLLLVPAHTPARAHGTHKTPMLPYGARIKLCQEAILSLLDPALQKRISLCEIEKDLPKPNHTWRTLQALEKSYAPMAFLMGADQFASFENWENPEGILKLASLIVVSRATHTQTPARDVAERFTAHVIDTKTSEASSTQIKAFLASRTPIPKTWIPDKLQSSLLQLDYKGELLGPSTSQGC